jgi:hypothetical protein
VAYLNPSVADFKSYFDRDFPYGTDMATSVLDSDIGKAFVMVNVNVNQALFADQSAYTVGYLLLAAHYLVMNLRASSQGINGQFAFLEQSKGVGGVNQSSSIPQRILDNPEWSILAKTNYGAQFLQLVLPQMGGQVFIAYGSTRP